MAVADTRPAAAVKRCQRPQLAQLEGMHARGGQAPAMRLAAPRTYGFLPVGCVAGVNDADENDSPRAAELARLSWPRATAGSGPCACMAGRGRCWCCPGGADEASYAADADASVPCSCWGRIGQPGAGEEDDFNPLHGI